MFDSSRIKNSILVFQKEGTRNNKRQEQVLKVTESKFQSKSEAGIKGSLDVPMTPQMSSRWNSFKSLRQSGISQWLLVSLFFLW